MKENKTMAWEEWNQRTSEQRLYQLPIECAQQNIEIIFKKVIRISFLRWLATERNAIIQQEQQRDEMFAQQCYRVGDIVQHVSMGVGEIVEWSEGHHRDGHLVERGVRVVVKLEGWGGVLYCRGGNKGGKGDKEDKEEEEEEEEEEEGSRVVRSLRVLKKKKLERTDVVVDGLMSEMLSVVETVDRVADVVSVVEELVDVVRVVEETVAVVTEVSYRFFLVCCLFVVVVVCLKKIRQRAKIFFFGH